MADMKKYWITKYALTQGIFQVDAELAESSDTMIHARKPNGFASYYHRNEWHHTKQAAVARAKEMQKKKLISLQKQIKKIEALKF